MDLTQANIDALKSRIFGTVDDQLQQDLYDALCSLEEKVKAEQRPIIEKAYDLHMEIMAKNAWCYGEHDCQYCGVKGMCDAAQKLRDEIESYDKRKKGEGGSAK